MPDPDKDPDRIVVDSLREIFDPLAKQLTPEIEPAIIYSPQMRSSDTADEKSK